MRMEDFRELADTWGGDIARWPEHQRAAARALAETAEGREVLARAQAFDTLLATPPAVDPARARRVAHAVTLQVAAMEQPRAAPWWRREWLLPAAGVACSGLVGVMMALTLPAAPADEPEPQNALAMILDSGTVMTLEVQ